MVDVIGARCLMCGHIIRVPAALGGRKAKCPQCHGIISIPSPGDSTLDFISDADLPEVARDDGVAVDETGAPEEPDVVDGQEVVDGEEVAEEEERVPAAVHRDRPSAIRRGNTTSRRPAPTGRGATQTRRRGGGRGNNAAVAILIAVGVLAVGGIAVAMLIKKTPAKQSGPVDPDSTGTGTATKSDPEEDAVRRRFDAWVEALNSSNLKSLGAFYGETEEAHKKARDYFDPIFFKGKLEYQNVRDVKITMGKTTASISFTFDRVTTSTESDQKMTMAWQKFGDAWGILDAPTK